jgi:hypothetical protein
VNQQAAPLFHRIAETADCWEVRDKNSRTLGFIRRVRGGRFQISKSDWRDGWKTRTFANRHIAAVQLTRRL